MYLALTGSQTWVRVDFAIGAKMPRLRPRKSTPDGFRNTIPGYALRLFCLYTLDALGENLFN